MLTKFAAEVCFFSPPDKLATRKGPGSRPEPHCRGKRAVHTWSPRAAWTPCSQPLLHQTRLRPMLISLCYGRATMCQLHAHQREQLVAKTQATLRATQGSRAAAAPHRDTFRLQKHVSSALNTPHCCIVHLPPPPPDQSRLFTAQQNARQLAL